MQNYMPLRAQQRETCKGSSDNVMVPINEFRATLDGAIRLARYFLIVDTHPVYS